jgi:phage baseplate assembly protein gpV
MEHAYVESSYYEDGAVYCDLRPARPRALYDKVRVLKPQAGFFQVPKQGDRVAVDQLDNGEKFITHIISSDTSVPEVISEGELKIQLDDGTRVSFEENGDSYDVQIEASGDVYIEGINFAEHTHDYGDSTINDTGTGSGSESTATKTSDPPQ